MLIPAAHDVTRRLHESQVFSYSLHTRLQINELLNIGCSKYKTEGKPKPVEQAPCNSSETLRFHDAASAEPLSSSLDPKS